MPALKVAEFHCIMPIENVASVLEHGILCHEAVQKRKHQSVAMPEIQELRENKEIPGGGRLHSYANLYFHARNPMLYKRQAHFDRLCVLRIETRVGHEPGVVFTDGNASAKYARFFDYNQVREGQLPLRDIFAEDWTDPDPQI